MYDAARVGKREEVVRVHGRPKWGGFPFALSFKTDRSGRDNRYAAAGDCQIFLTVPLLTCYDYVLLLSSSLSLLRSLHPHPRIPSSASLPPTRLFSFSLTHSHYITMLSFSILVLLAPLATTLVSAQGAGRFPCNMIVGGLITGPDQNLCTSVVATGANTGVASTSVSRVPSPPTAKTC